MKKLETGNIETGTTSTFATIGRLLAAVVLLVSGGCQSMKENGMLSPRSGELFQTTKMGTGVLASSCVFPTVLGWFYVQKGHLIGLPVAIIFSPFAIVAPVLDLGVVSPLTDLACLPYDLSQPQHGFYIRIVDEDGKPIPGAQISGSVENDEDSHLLSTTDLSGTTDEAGEFYVGRLFKCKGSMEAKASGYAPWLGSESIRLPKNEKCSGGQTAVTNAIPAGERIVLQYVMKRSNVGDWNQKSDLSREEVEKLCVGTWRPDEDACKFIVDELGMKTGQENPAEHWIELRSDGTARSHSHGRSNETRRLHGGLCLGMPGYLCDGHGVRACPLWMRRKNIARMCGTILGKTIKVSILLQSAKTITYPHAVYLSSARCLS